MANPIYSQYGDSQFGNMADTVKQFQQFKQRFKGDPKAQVQQMLNSGQISQEDYNRAVQMANAMQRMMNTR